MKIKSNFFILLTSLWFGVVLNIAIYYKLYFILEKLEHVGLGLVFSIPLLFIAVFNIAFSILTIKYIEKPLIIIWMILSSVITYYMFYYGVVFDSDMFVNIFETNTGESLSFLNLHMVTWFLFIGLLPTILVARSNIIYQGLYKEVRTRISSIVVSLVVIGGIYFLYYKDISSVARNNRDLRTMLVPSYFTNSFFKYINHTYFYRPLPYREQGLDAKITKSDNKKNNLIIIAIGETARSMNFELNGYAKDTNKYTKGLNVISFKKVNSCGTATAVSVPCMFSSLTRPEYKHELAESQDNLIDIIKRAGVHQVWFDNDNGCKGVCQSAEYTRLDASDKKWCDGLYCIDEILVEKTENELAALPNNDTVIFLHLIGSHGPTYYKRYPVSHNAYTPDCPRSDIQNCTNQQLVNTYDNTILYTDYVLSRLIGLLKSKSDEWNTALLYVSDHGESLGEYGLYLHGVPYFMAPDEQTTVPMLTWLSDSYVRQNKLELNNLREQAENKEYSHDNFFHSVLGLLGIETNLYNKDMDIFYTSKRA